MIIFLDINESSSVANGIIIESYHPQAIVIQIANKVQMGDLHFGRKIGCGTFAKVYKGTMYHRCMLLKKLRF